LHSKQQSVEKRRCIHLLIVRSFLIISGGEVVLNSVELRLEALEELLPIPVRVTRGQLSRLQLRVPWTALGSEPVEISANTIELVLAPRHDFENVIVQRKRSSEQSDGKPKERNSLLSFKRQTLDLFAPSQRHRCPAVTRLATIFATKGGL
jgi:hypothetical protein